MTWSTAATAGMRVKGEQGMPTDSARIAAAVALAASVHTDQRRKGARREPYFNHLAEVAALVGEATGAARTRT